MATTDYGVNHPLAKKHWQSELMKETLKSTYAMQFMGTDKNSLVQIKTETGKDAGDRIRFGIRSQLQGAGIAGDGTLEGNEEALETFTQDVTIDQLRHAVRSKGKMSEQRVPFSVRAEAKDGLADWWADRYDTWFFNQLCGMSGIADTRYTGMQAATAPDADHVVYAGGVLAESSLSNTSTHKFTLDLIDKAVEKAKLAKNALRPIMVGSEKFWVMFLHTYQVTSLRTNTQTGQWLDIQKAAMSGGDVKKNPIFSGALGVYNGVILHESTRIPAVTGNDGNAVTPTVRRAVLAGAQAACFAFGQGSSKNSMDWNEELFDYKNQLGVEAGCIAGLVKTRFNGSDYGTVVVSTYAAPAA